MKSDSKILIIDDDEIIVELLSDYLTRLGYRPVSAFCGKDGLALFEQGGIQLVLLDLNLPDVDGMDLLQTLTHADRSVPIIMITGAGTIEKAVEAIKTGAYDFIAKPFELSSLEVIMSRALERYALIRQRGVFKGLALALLVSIPIWLVLGVWIASFMSPQ